MIGAVILAAGSGTRLGGVAKATLVHEGQTYLARILARCDEANVGTRVVVVGPPFDTVVRAELDHIGSSSVIVVENPAPGRGMASSVAVGFAALLAHDAITTPVTAASTSAFLWPVDHPFVHARTLAALLAADASEVVRPRFAGRGGHPPLVARSVWPTLAACADAPDGARGVLAQHRVHDIDVDDAGVVRDVDVPRDLPGVAR